MDVLFLLSSFSPSRSRSTTVTTIFIIIAIATVIDICYGSMSSADFIPSSKYKTEYDFQSKKMDCSLLPENQLNGASEGQMQWDCYSANKDLILNVNGTKYYSFAKSAPNRPIMQCLAPKAAILKKCSNGFKVDSTCQYGCPHGFKKARSNTTCRIYGPQKDATMQWDGNPLCISETLEPDDPDDPGWGDSGYFTKKRIDYV